MTCTTRYLVQHTMLCYVIKGDGDVSTTMSETASHTLASLLLNMGVFRAEDSKAEQTFKVAKLSSPCNAA